MPTRLLVMIAAAAAVLLVACGDDDEDIVDEDEVRTAGAQGQSLRVTAVDFGFEPNELSARGGEATEIIFVNEGDADHTFTIDGLVDEELEGGGQTQFTFTAPAADAEFYCRFHDEMRGTLVIDPTDEPRTDGAPTVDASDGATPDETDDDDNDNDDDDDDNSGSGSDNSGSGSGGYTY